MHIMLQTKNLIVGEAKSNSKKARQVRMVPLVGVGHLARPRTEVFWMIDLYSGFSVLPVSGYSLFVVIYRIFLMKGTDS